MQSTSSGISDLDDLLAGLLPGDNVVWVTAGHTQVAAIERTFLEEGLRRGEPCSYVTTELSPNRLRSDFGGDLRILDARPGRPLADPTALEMRILNAARQEPGRVVVDSLDAFVRRLDRSALSGSSAGCARSSTTWERSPTGGGAAPPPVPDSSRGSPRSRNASSNWE